jgi:hypothetical protein
MGTTLGGVIWRIGRSSLFALPAPVTYPFSIREIVAKLLPSRKPGSWPRC